VFANAHGLQFPLMSSNQYLNTFSENATRLGMRLQETFSEHTRDLAIARGSGGGYLDSAGGSSTGGEEKTRAVIRKQLDSSSDREKLDAMKKLVAVSSFISFHFVSCFFLKYCWLLKYLEIRSEISSYS